MGKRTEVCRECCGMKTDGDHNCEGCGGAGVIEIPFQDDSRRVLLKEFTRRLGAAVRLPLTDSATGQPSEKFGFDLSSWGQFQDYAPLIIEGLLEGVPYEKFQEDWKDRLRRDNREFMECRREQHEDRSSSWIEDKERGVRTYPKVAAGESWIEDYERRKRR